MVLGSKGFAAALTASLWLAVRLHHRLRGPASHSEVVLAMVTGLLLQLNKVEARHPQTGELNLRITRGNWPKDVTKGQTIKRAVFPQSIPYSAERCKATLALIETAIGEVEKLGAELDAALQTYPERFRPTAPVVNHLGLRPKKPKAPPAPKTGKKKRNQ